MKKTILHLCADIGSDTKPYKDNGYNVICVGYKIDVRKFVPPPDVYGIIANPPCTMFSQARTKAKTPRDLRKGMELVEACLRIIWECQYKMVSERVPHKLAFWAIENPATGYLKHYLGNPTFVYCHSQFGSAFRKRTALWGYFKKPQILNEVDKSKPIYGGDYGGAPFSLRFSGDGGSKASTPIGFAQAFFEANP